MVERKDTPTNPVDGRILHILPERSPKYEVLPIPEQRDEKFLENV